MNAHQRRIHRRALDRFFAHLPAIIHQLTRVAHAARACATAYKLLSS